MTTLNQWAVLVTLKNVENRLCCDCKVPLTKSDAYCSSYGTWVCSNCAAAHKTLILAEEEWFRHALNDQLTEDEVNFLLHETNLSTSGNTGFNELFERHIPSSWVKLTPGCSPKERALWIRAKYAVELFRIPNDKIGGDFKLIGGSSSRGAGASSSGGPGSPTAAGKKKNKKQRDEVNPAVLPARIVDYFLVVSATADKTKLSAVPPTLESIPKLPVVPTIQTCYPPSDTYSDMAMPELLAPFLFPAGVELSSTEKQPSFFTFVLTDVSGVKLYGAVMHVHELLEPLDLLPELGLPASFASVITGSGSSSSSPGSGASSDASKLWPVVYVPKALVVLSHYPFFSLYRQFLESLYHISLSPSLLPLERYVINFFSETPLPPPGQVEVNFAVNPQKVVQLTRPRRNQLPMIDFSFRPLFMLLSVDNILSVVTALCSELPVCIVCENVALLTPVCETLLAFLFPFTWQGAYIPVLPEHMTEILDAPVPYLMGMQRSYFDQHNMANCANRPAMSVFVDLDNDVVHLGRADDLFGCPDGDDGSELMTLRRPHSKLLSKLKPKLVEFGGCIYHCTGYQDEIRRFGVSFPGNEHLVPMDGLTDSSNAGGTGTGINIMHRDSSSRLLTGGNNGKRGSVATPDAAVSGGHGHIEASPGVAATRNVNTSGSQEYCTRVISASVGARARGSAPGPGLLDPQFNSHSPTDAFNSQELRFAFLRMFVALLIDYQDFISETGTGTGAGTGTGTGGGVGAAAAAADQNQTVQQQQQRADGESGTTDTHSPALTPTASGSALPVFEFDNERFLAHSGGDEFLRNLLATQMFAKFMQEKLTSMQQAAINTNTTNINNNSNVPTPSPAENMEVRYFDESILSKNNRSMIKFKKASTPFLSDMRDGISETYTTPAPNHWGIPLNAEPYTHNKFPTKLNAAFLTPVRRPRLLVKEGSETTRANDQGSKTANMISNTMVHRQQHTDQYHGVGNPNGMDHDSSNDINNSNSGVDVVFHNDAAMEMFLGEAQLSVITVKKWITQFQAIVRMRFQRRLFLARFAELKRLMEMVALKTRIYNFVRMAICRIRYKKCCFRLRRMQALFRGARCYRKYKRVLALVLRAQTCFRRHRAAKFQWARNISLIVTIRGYLVGMWNIGAVPLVDRSRFWYFAGVVASTQFADLVRGCSNSSSSDTSKMTRAAVGSAAYPRCYCSYLALAIHVTEFNRMFTALGWTFREGTRGNGGGNSSNGNNSNAHSYHRLSLRLEIVANGNLVSSTSLPALASAPARALATEREELYKTMKATMDDDKAASVGGGASAKTSLFSAFQLSATKKRKQALAQALWILPLPQVRGGGDGNSNHVDSSFSKTSDVSARVVLKILSVREATLYSASAMPVDAAVVTPSLAAFIAVCKRVDNAAAGSAGSSSVVPVEVSQMDKLWLLGAYCSRITGACYEHARLCAPAMALVVLQHRELRVRQAECVAIKSSLQFLGLGSSMNGATSSTGGRRRRSSVSAAAGASAAVGLIRRESRAFSVNYETSDGIISTSRGKNTPVGSPVPASRLMF